MQSAATKEKKNWYFFSSFICMNIILEIGTVFVYICALQRLKSFSIIQTKVSKFKSDFFFKQSIRHPVLHVKFKSEGYSLGD